MKQLDRRPVRLVVAATAAIFVSGSLLAQVPAGEGPRLGTSRTTQADITGGALTFDEIRAAGLKMFSTPFNVHDGYGDGIINAADTTSPGGRPTLQGNGTFLRVNGLDAQTCMECHSVGSNAVAPFRFGVGGVGGSNNNVLFQPRNVDVADFAGNGIAAMDGRYINPPFLFGSGGVELLAKEMTADLQAVKASAMASPDVAFDLDTKGVNFGQITFDSTTLTFDESAIEGIEHDLAVRPFGRKGEFATVRGFDIGAMEFHFGMQPVEQVGTGVDSDGDGITDEIMIGELSALHVFNTNLEKPEMPTLTPEARRGFNVFNTVGCSECHVPLLRTDTTVLEYAFPEVDTDPSANVFYSSDLSTSTAGFETTPAGGLKVRLFSDLKNHDMGPGLEETFAGAPNNSEFVTARLWGVADTAPYLHDGRATTLTQAILAHGGEAQAKRDAFDALADTEKIQLLTFLRSLKTPLNPAQDLLP